MSNRQQASLEQSRPFLILQWTHRGNCLEVTVKCPDAFVFSRVEHQHHQRDDARSHGRGVPICLIQRGAGSVGDLWTKNLVICASRSTLYHQAQFAPSWWRRERGVRGGARFANSARTRSETPMRSHVRSFAILRRWPVDQRANYRGVGRLRHLRPIAGDGELRPFG